MTEIHQQSQLKLAKQITQRIPGIFLIANVILLIVLAIVDPRGYFVISAPFSLFNLYLLTKIGYWSTKGLNRFKRAEGKDYYKKYLEKKQTNPHLAKWEDVVHFVIIPNYKESEGTLQEMLNSLAMSKVAKTHMIPVLAMEEREEGAAEKARTLIKNNKECFKDVMFTLHPPTIPGELKGKSSNEAWAAQKVFEEVKRKEMDRDYALITICDADSNLHVKHFDALTYKFCKDPNRHFKIFQGPMVCYKNYHTTPVPTRLLSMAVSLHEIAALQDPFDVHIPFSTYSLSCTLAQNTGGWDGDVIAEDWHMLIKSFFNSGGRVTVQSLPFPVLCYAVEADGWWASVKARYDQGMRHCWGINELGYLFYKAFEGFFVAPKAKRPNPLRTLLLSLKACSLHYFNSMGLIYLLISSLVIGAYTYIPALAATEKAAAVTGKWSLLFKVTGMLVLPPTLVTLFTHVRLVQYSVGHQVYGKWIWLRAVQWALELALFQAPVAFIFGCWPTFYAAIKQFFTDKLDYVVAAKPVVNAVSIKESVAINVSEDKENSSDEQEQEDETHSEHQPLVAQSLVTV